MLFAINGRNRYIAGNICLVVLLALLFSMIAGAFAPAPAEAFPVDQGTKPAETHDGYRIVIRPATKKAYTDTLTVIANWIRDNVANQSVTKLVYEDPVVDTVYGVVYGSIYFVYAQLTDRVNVDFPFISGSVYAVYALTDPGTDIRDKVPIPRYVAPAPPPPAPPVPAPVAGRTESATANQVGDTATVAPVVETVSRAFADPAVPIAAIVIPAAITARNIVVEMPHNLVNAAVQSPKPLRIEAPAFAVQLPEEIFRMPMILDAVGAGRAFSLTLTMNDVTEAGAPAVAATVATLTDAASYSPPLRVFQLALNVDEPGRPSRIIRDFEGGVAGFDADYKNDDVVGVADERTLNFYRHVNNTLQPQLTWVDSAANRATGWFHSFSRFVLMSYKRSFADTVGHWSQRHVELMASKHIIRGVDNVNFDPDRNISRAEFAALLQRIVGLREAGGNPIFHDVKPGAWYYGAVQAAAGAGLVKGYNGEFRPDAVISRQEMAVMLARALDRLVGEATLTEVQINSSLAEFKDKDAIGAWAREAVAMAVRRGIIKGRTATTFAPAANATRAESATMLQRAVESAGLLK
ncbi:MAG: S-layer homology domain-containing protein [Bacillota bacterium]